MQQGPAPWSYFGLNPAAAPARVVALPNPPNERDIRLQKRKQANRDSAKRSKMRKKKENEELIVKSQELKHTHEALVRQLSAARERTSQLKTLNLDLRKQLTELGVKLPC